MEVDIGGLREGELRTVEWRGRPVWILRRTRDMLAGLGPAGPQLSDPASRVTSQQPEYARNAARSIQPELLATVALCAHLECIPSYSPDVRTAALRHRPIS